MADVRVGVDLGQMHDYTAIIVNECSGDTHNIRVIERPRLGTKYTKIVKRVAHIRDKIKKRGNTPQIFVDATGVGRPVIDEFEAKGVYVKAVTIVQGSGVTMEGKELHIGKLALVSRLNLLLSDERISWNGKTKLGKKLTTELHRFQIKVTKSANAVFEASTGHDDMVIALALAVWEKERVLLDVFSIDLGPDRDTSHDLGTYDNEPDGRWSAWPPRN